MSPLCAEEKTVSSPDGNIVVTVSDQGGQLRYSATLSGITVVQPSLLGLKTSFDDFSQNMKIVEAQVESGRIAYNMTRIKKAHVDKPVNTLTVKTQSKAGQLMNIVMKLTDEAIAFRYELPRPKRDNPKHCIVQSEETSFLLPADTRTFICPQIGPKTGWEQTKPSYEEEYVPDDVMQKPSRFGQGYTFPCLFRIPSPTNAGQNLWALISETGVSSSYCGSHISDYQEDRGYTIAFPQAGENGGYGSAEAYIPLPGKTPWRTITLGTTLAPIVENTAAYDFVEPLYQASQEYVPGRYTWSWLIWQDNSMNYADQVQFIDLASKMGYEYCLVDAGWDENIGRERMAELSRYARDKGVHLLLWYNSNGFWNNAPQSPRDCMSTSVAREREMAWMKSIGVKGIKVDFFGGDKQETMRLYEDIMSDANRYGLQCIFHGCTLPRGWERMYPNYVGSEAVLASENVYFSEHHADREGFELTMHPFCRNAVGAMDWGGVIMNRYLSRDNKSRHARKTGDVFEMASGIVNQCSVNGMLVQPNNLDELEDFEIDFLKSIPTAWSDTRFIDGYPGRYIVMARQHEGCWYLAGLNGTDQPITLRLDVSQFFTKSALYYYLDQPKKKGQTMLLPQHSSLKPDKKGMVKVTIQPMGGIIVTE